MTMVLVRMKYGCMGIGFLRQYMAFLVVVVERIPKIHLQKTLRDG